MKAEISKDKKSIVITMPISASPETSKSGKSYNLATTGGLASIPETWDINGVKHNIKIGVNVCAMIPK